MTKAFVTGSHAYGTPRPDSDIDLVVLVSKEDLMLLTEQAYMVGCKFQDNYDNAFSNPLRFGNLNLICTTDLGLYQTWVEGTNQLKKRKPVKREEACALFIKLRQEWAEKRNNAK